MYRRTFAIGAAALALGLAACSGGTTTPTPTPTTEAPAETSTPTETEAPAADYSGITLTVWTDETRQAPLKAAAAVFEEATGATIELVQKNYEDIRTDFTTQVPTGNGPDITVGAHDWLGELITNGVVAPITLGDKAAEFEPVAVSAFSQDGSVYGVPYAIENVALIRNTDLAAEAPATWDDAIAAGQDAGTKYPILIQTSEEGDPYTYYPLQTSFGAPVFEQNDDGSYNTTLALGGEGGLSFANWLAEQGEAGNLDTSITYDIAVEAFSKGESPFIIGGPWMLDSFTDLDLAIDPIPSAGGETASPFVGVAGFYLSAQSQNTIVATDFLVNYIATKDVQVKLYEAGNRTPALITAAEEVSADPIVAGFAAVAADAVPMPSIPQMNSVWQFWGVTQAGIISGKQEPEAAWTKMVSDIEAAIG